MPIIVGESSTMSEHNNNNRFMKKPSKFQQPISNLDQNTPQIHSKKKKKNFTSKTFRGLGCTASPQVSVPVAAAVAIRSSANWEEGKKVVSSRKKKKNKLIVGPTLCNNNPQSAAPSSSSSSSSCLCGPGIGLITDAASVDCVVSRRPHLRERPSSIARRMVNSDDFSYFDNDPDSSHSRMDVFGSRHHRYARHRSPDGLDEIMMLQSNLMMGGSRSFGLDRYRDWRLDVDTMSYEELLELGDKIGYVNTGLREDEILQCLRTTRLSLLDDISSYCPSQTQWKCSICQEEFEGEEEMGKLDCKHCFHINCIKQWLAHKKTCPICKTSALSQN